MPIAVDYLIGTGSLTGSLIFSPFRFFQKTLVEGTSSLSGPFWSVGGQSRRWSVHVAEVYCICLHNKFLPILISTLYKGFSFFLNDQHTDLLSSVGFCDA